jgi:hypothetical protein
MADRFCPRQLQRRNEGPLKAVGRIRIVSQQPIDGRPDYRPILLDDL